MVYRVVRIGNELNTKSDMKKIFILLSMAALVVMGALITSCNKMEKDNGPRVNPDGSITYTTTLHMGADTKTIINGETGSHTFKAGDQIAVIYSNGTETEKAISVALTEDDIKNGGRSAKFTVTLYGLSPAASPTPTPAPHPTVKAYDLSNTVTYIYPASMALDNGSIDYSALASQHGTLTSLASNQDCCSASTTWDGTGDLLPTLTLENRITIGKFTIKNPSGTAINEDLTTVTISEGSNTYEITPDGSSTFTSDPIWVAMRPISAGARVTVTASDGTNNYTKTVTIAAGNSLEAGSITPVNVTMTLVPSILTLSYATSSDYGKVVCAAGHLHDAMTAVPTGCTAVGILGQVTETGHGLILALEEASMLNLTWNTINSWESVTYAGTTLKLLPDDSARGNLASYTTLGSTTVSNWCAAQKSDYEAIFINLGSTASDNRGYTFDDHVNAYLTTNVGGNALNGYYWSATASEYDERWAWSFAQAPYYWDGSMGKSDDNVMLRPVIGF
jgi:hypothetical protein